MGEKLFAVPWKALKLDTANHRFMLDVSKDKLKDAPGFDPDHWPDMADQTWSSGVHSFYGVEQRSSSGGSSMSGSSMSGNPMGGSSTGGMSTGGMSTGGSTSGLSSGDTSTGGLSSGGSTIGGSTIGGSTTGGSTTGGVY